MAGGAGTLSKAWTLLRSDASERWQVDSTPSKGLDLEDPVPSSSNIYLGCAQSPCDITESEVQAKTDFLGNLLVLPSGII